MTSMDSAGQCERFLFGPLSVGAGLQPRPRQPPTPLERDSRVSGNLLLTLFLLRELSGWRARCQMGCVRPTGALPQNLRADRPSAA